MQVSANAVASAADIVFFFFINYILLNLFLELEQMPSSLKKRGICNYVKILYKKLLLSAISDNTQNRRIFDAEQRS